MRKTKSQKKLCNKNIKKQEEEREKSSTNFL